jgi:hypothetical protein
MVRIVKSRRPQLAGYLAKVRKMWNMYRILMGKHKAFTWNTKKRWKDDIKIHVYEMHGTSLESRSVEFFGINELNIRVSLSLY